jgi:hypothetical protein
VPVQSSSHHNHYLRSAVIINLSSMPRSPKWSLPLTFPSESYVRFVFLCMLQVSPIYSSLIFRCLDSVKPLPNMKNFLILSNMLVSHSEQVFSLPQLRNWISAPVASLFVLCPRALRFGLLFPSCATQVRALVFNTSVGYEF